jgi:hypothetical protein
MERDMERFQRRSPPVPRSDFATDAPFVGAARPQPAERGLRIGENALPVARDDRCASAEMKDAFGEIFAIDGVLVARPPAEIGRLRPARRDAGGKIAMPVKPAIERREADREGLGQIMMGCTEAAQAASLTGEFGTIAGRTGHGGRLHRRGAGLNRRPAPRPACP